MKSEREQFERHSRKLTKINFDGRPGWLAREDTALPPEEGAKGSVLLLPYFDAYAVGSHPRSRLFPGKAATRALSPSGQAGNYPVLVIDGVVGGVWHQRRSGRRIDVTIEPLTLLTADQRRALENQVERLGEILEGEPRLTVGTVTAGAHA